jgi:hypothetical protein
MFHKQISRRDLLRLMGAGVAASAASGLPPGLRGRERTVTLDNTSLQTRWWDTAAAMIRPYLRAESTTFLQLIDRLDDLLTFGFDAIEVFAPCKGGHLYGGHIDASWRLMGRFITISPYAGCRFDPLPARRGNGRLPLAALPRIQGRGGGFTRVGI